MCKLILFVSLFDKQFVLLIISQITQVITMVLHAMHCFKINQHYQQAVAELCLGQTQILMPAQAELILKIEKKLFYIISKIVLGFARGLQM